MFYMIDTKRSFFEKLFCVPLVNEIGLRVKIPFLVMPLLK